MPHRFSVKNYVHQYRSTPGNVPADLYRKRLDECAGCAHRDGGICRVINREIRTFALNTHSDCPSSIWDDAGLKKTSMPTPKQPEPVKPPPAAPESPPVQTEPAADQFRGSITEQMDVQLVTRLIQLPPAVQHPDWWCWQNVQEAHRIIADMNIDFPSRPATRKPRGIVVVGGGKFLVSAYVTIRVIRQVGCTLPIELWHLEGEITDRARAALVELGVECVNASNHREAQRFRFLRGHRWEGWQLKAFALAYSSFAEVLQLDADCYPVRNPEFVFEWKPYRQWGAAFWPDIPKHADMRPAHCWKIFGVEPLADLPTESGQMLVNKELCWREVWLSLYYNSHADFVYHIIYGDKDTYPIAWQQLGRKYARMSPAPLVDDVALRQRDHNGETLFIHRVHDKFRLPETRFANTPQHNDKPKFCRQFPLEQFCHEALTDAAKLVDAGTLEPTKCMSHPKS